MLNKSNIQILGNHSRSTPHTNITFFFEGILFRYMVIFRE